MLIGLKNILKNRQESDKEGNDSPNNPSDFDFSPKKSKGLKNQKGEKLGQERATESKPIDFIQLGDERGNRVHQSRPVDISYVVKGRRSRRSNKMRFQGPRDGIRKYKFKKKFKK